MKYIIYFLVALLFCTYQVGVIGCFELTKWELVVFSPLNAFLFFMLSDYYLEVKK